MTLPDFAAALSRLSSILTEKAGSGLILSILTHCFMWNVSEVRMVADNEALNHFVAGLVSGEGSFFISVQTSRAYAAGHQIVCGFALRVREADHDLVAMAQRALGPVGRVYRRGGAMTLLVRKVGDLTEGVIPFFDRYPLRGQQQVKFALWKQAVQLVAQRQHVTRTGQAAIMAIKAQMERS